MPTVNVKAINDYIANTREIREAKMNKRITQVHIWRNIRLNCMLASIEYDNGTSKNYRIKPKSESRLRRQLRKMYWHRGTTPTGDNWFRNPYHFTM